MQRALDKANPVLWVLRKYWPAVLVLVLAVWRNLKAENPSISETIFIAMAGAGVLMNLLVIILNGAMPVSDSIESGTVENLGRYKTMDDKTRLAWLGDWIDVGWAYFSPGDFLILFGCAGLMLRVIGRTIF